MQGSGPPPLLDDATPPPSTPRRSARRRAGEVLRVALAITAVGALIGLFLFVRRPRVLLFGDSITVWGEKPLTAAMRWRDDPTVVGFPGWRIDELVPPARSVAPDSRGFVILNVGTNDALQTWPLDQSEVALREMVDVFASARCVALVTVNEGIFHPPTDVAANARALNEVIRKVALERGLVVIDWSAFLRDYNLGPRADGDLTYDLVHPNPAGYAKMAEFYHDSLARCP